MTEEKLSAEQFIRLATAAVYEEAKRELSEDIAICTFWVGKDLCVGIHETREWNDLKRQTFTLQDLCFNEVNGWHNGVSVDKEHHGYMMDISKALRDQADQIDALLDRLDLRD